MAPRPLRLYDLRHICTLLCYIFDNRKSDHGDVIDAIYTLTLAYGLCSLGRQIELLQQRFKDVPDAVKSMQEDARATTNPVERRGVRVGATENDAIAVLLLKELFPQIDGYVAHAMFSPFHIEKSDKVLPAELVLFNPAKSEIRLVTDVRSLSNQITRMHINDILQGAHFLSPLPLKGDVYNVWLMKGGGHDTRYNPNKWFDRKHKRAAVAERKSKRVVGLIRGGGEPTVEPLVDTFWDRPNMPIQPWRSHQN